MTPAKWEKIEAEELNKLSPKNSYIRYEKEYIHKNGTIIPIELLVTAKYNNENQIDHYVAFVTNITNRKQSENKINIERDKLTTILESMQDGVYLINRDFDIEYVNPVLIKDFGLPGDKKCHKYFHDSDKPCTFCKNEDVFAGKSVQWEWTSPKNGKTYDLVDTPINNSDGSISKLEIFRDITYRKESENKIARFSRIFEDTLNEIYLFDADTLKFTQVNNAAQNNLGYSMDELRNMTPLDFKPEFTAELFAKLVEPLRKGEKQKVLFETVHQRKDQSLYNVEVHLQLLQFEKENVFAAIIIDVTERKQAETKLMSEQNLRDVVDNLMDGVAIVDDHAKHIHVNPKFSEITGYSRIELLNMTGWDFTRPEDRIELQKRMKDQISGKAGVSNYERIIIKKDGTEVSVEMSTTVTMWQEKKRLMAIIRDITERKQVEKELAEHREGLEQLVDKRTEELKEKNEELDNTLKVFVGREYKINELQKRIRVLEGAKDND